MRFLLPFLLLLSAVSLFGAGELSGRRAPGFALPDVNLNYHDLADLRGRVVIIEIMQTSCPNCIALSQKLEKMKQQYGTKIAVLTIVNPPDNQANVKRFVAGNAITSPVLFDCGQVTASYMKITPQRPSLHVPHLFLVDQNGLIHNDFAHIEANRNIFEGPGLASELDKLLAGKVPSSATPKK